MALRGDFVKLRQLSKKLNAMSRPAFKRELIEKLAVAALALVDEGFEKSITPWDAPWKPLRFRVGKPLLDTRRLSASIDKKTSDRGFHLFTNVRYAHVHQDGKIIRVKNARALAFKPRGKRKFVFAKQVKVPARPFLPKKRIGPRWTRAFKQVIRDHMAAWQRRG